MEKYDIRKIFDRYINKINVKFDSQAHNILINILKKSQFVEDLIKTHSNFEDYIYKFIIENIIIKQSDKKVVLINEKDNINGVYIILAGYINIYKKSLLKEYINPLNSVDSVVKANSDKSSYVKKYNLRKTLNKDKLVLTKTITTSGTLGDSELSKRIKTFPFYAETETPCLIAFLNNSSYIELINHIEKYEIEQLRNFILKSKIFDNVDSYIEKIMQCLTIKKYKKGEYVFNQNDPFQNFYIIKQGTINLSNSKKIESLNYECNDISFCKNRPLSERYSPEKLTQIKGNVFEMKSYNIIDLEAIELLGEIEYYFNYDKYLFTALCKEDCILIEVDAKMFKKVYKKGVLNNFNSKIVKKREMIEIRIKNIKKEVDRQKSNEKGRSRNIKPENLHFCSSIGQNTTKKLQIASYKNIIKSIKQKREEKDFLNIKKFKEYYKINNFSKNVNKSISRCLSEKNFSGCKDGNFYDNNNVFQYFFELNSSDRKKNVLAATKVNSNIKNKLFEKAYTKFSYYRKLSAKNLRVQDKVKLLKIFEDKNKKYRFKSPDNFKYKNNFS